MSLGGEESSTAVIVYGPDGKAYGSPAQAKAAGVSNPTMSPPAGVPISYPGRQPYTSAPMPYIPTPSSGGRNRYAEIMSQFGQSQPFSFFGMPSGGFNPYASDYTGGFTPYQRTFTPQPIVNPVEPTVPMVGGGRGGADREGPSAFSQMTPAERAAYYAANPTEGKIALGFQDLLGNATLMGQIGKYFGADGFYDSRLEKLGLDPESFAYGPPDPNFSSQAAAAARNEALQAAITAANADTGLVANPMSLDPSQRVVSTPVVTAPPVVAPAPAPAPVPTITAREIYRGEENDPVGYTKERIGKDDYRYTRPVTVNVADFTDSEGNFDFSALQRAGLSISGIGGGQGSSGGGYTVGGYAPGSQAAAAAASGTVGGYGPGTPGFNSGGAGLYKGGYVSMQHLGGPDPEGPDDGYAALKDGEYVINDKAVKKYGIELMNAINSGKISKGKLRGLLEM